MHCKYLPVVPYKALENFSKALYGTTGGTYSACIIRPVMVRWSIRSLGNPVCQIDTSEALARESDIFLLSLFFLALFIYSFNIFRVGSLDLWHSLLIIHNK